MEQHGVFCTVFNLEQQLEPLSHRVLFVTTERYNSDRESWNLFYHTGRLILGFPFKIYR